MNTGRLERIRQLFEQASALPQEEQSRFLDEHCPEENIREEVEVLLSETMDATGDFEQIADEAIRSPLSELRREREESIQPIDTEMPFDDPEKAGTQIGPYQLIRLVGEGGFGTVWEAQQESPVSRRVAVKFLKVGMATKEIIRRFEAERQALAMMGHANIAQVYDAGATDSGRPYFVMEFVEGMPLTQFCDKYHLSLKQRLHVFNLICGAIQHAHQRGIVHRDLKPNNILVHYEDVETRLNPVLKIIDFGVAKVLRSTSSEHTMVTGLGQMIGTPAYMSPEQASFGSAIPDTRTDVYSLGILLYELLTGTLPFENDDFKERSIMEIQRIIQTKEPQRPSTRLSILQDTRQDELQQILDNRETDFRSLHRVLHTDLDWVIIRCLEKDPERRYSTANELLLDINRYLNSEPLVAGPPSATYRISKLVKRHRRTALASTFVVLSFVIGFIGTILGLVQATKARIAEAEQRQQAEARTRELEQVTAFQQSVFERLIPEQIGAEIFRSMLQSYDEVLKVGNIPEGERQTRVEALRQDLYQLNPTDLARQTFNDFVLTRSSQAIADQFSGQPMVEAALRESLAESFRQIGLLHEAIEEQTKAINLRLDYHQPNKSMLWEAQLGLAGILLEGRYHSDAREVLTNLSSDPGIATQADFAPKVHLHMGRLEYAMQNWDLAEDLFKQAHAEFASVHGTDHPSTLEAELESIHARQHFEYKLGYNSGYSRPGMEIALELEPAYKEFLDKANFVLGEDHPTIWKARHYLVDSISQREYIPEVTTDTVVYRNNIQRALDELEKVCNSQERVLGAYHPTTLESRIKFIRTQKLSSTEVDMPELNRERLSNMLAMLSTLLEIFDENHPSVIEMMAMISRLEYQFGFPNEAISRTRRVISILERTNRRDTVDAATEYFFLSWMLLYEFDYEGCMVAAQECMDIAERIEADIPESLLGEFRAGYIHALISVDDMERAAQLSEEWDMKQKTVMEWMGFGEELDRIKLQEIEEILDAVEETGFPDDVDYHGWAFFLTEKGRFEQAWLCLKEELVRSQITTDDDPKKLGWVEFYVDLAVKIGDFETARRWAQIWEENRENFLKFFPVWSGPEPAFPYQERNPYYTKEEYLLRSFVVWGSVGEMDKAEEYLKQFLDFREFLETDADPEIKKAYDKIRESEYARNSIPALETLAKWGHFVEGHELIASGPSDYYRIWFGPEDAIEAKKTVIDFYKKWDAADPEGGHLKHAIRWQQEVDYLEQRLAKWRNYETSTDN